MSRFVTVVNINLILSRQVPLKFRYPFLAQIMWYAADKYLRLLEKDKTERGLSLTPKKQNAVTFKAKETVGSKARSANKRVAKTDGEENREAGLSAVKESVEDDANETPGRRRSSRVAKNEATFRQEHENEEREKAVKKEESERGSVKRRAAKKSKDNEDTMDVNGENHDVEDANEKGSPEDNEEEEDKLPWRPVYLTRFEVDGLFKLIEKLRNWPQAKKNVPATLEDPCGLLDRLEVCVSGNSVGIFKKKKLIYPTATLIISRITCALCFLYQGKRKNSPKRRSRV